MIKVKKDKFKWLKKNLNKYRRLSVREMQEYQTFPDDFIFFYQQVADAYKMIGLPVNDLQRSLLNQLKINYFKLITKTCY